MATPATYSVLVYLVSSRILVEEQEATGVDEGERGRGRRIRGAKTNDGDS